jgi:hypothetical protein
MRWLALLAFFVVTPAFGQADVVASCGSVTIKAGTPHNVTVDLQGRSCRVGGGGGGTTPPPEGTGPSSVWSSGDAANAGATLSNGGLTLTVTNTLLPNAWQIVRTTGSRTSGKLYLELKTSTGLSITGHIGTASSGVNINSYLGASNYSFGWNPFAGGDLFGSAGYLVASSAGGTIRAAAANDVYGLAADFTTGKIWGSKNNVWSNSGDPVGETGGEITGFVPATVGPVLPSMAFSNVGSSTVWTIQATAGSQTYPPPAGYLAWDANAGGCAESTAYLARTSGGDEGGNATNVATLICGLVSDGVWGKFDAFYLPAQQNATDALLNLVGTSYPLTGTATFTTYQGFSGFSGSALDTGFNPTTASSPKFTQDSASISGWSYNRGNGALISNNPSPANADIIVNTFGNDYTDVNNVSGGGPPDYIASGGWSGLYSGDRNSATNVTFYLNGGNAQNYAQSSGTPNSSNLKIGSSAGAYPFSGIISEAHIGASLGSAGQTALYNRLLTYMTAVGWTPAATKPGLKPQPEPKK